MKNRYLIDYRSIAFSIGFIAVILTIMFSGISNFEKNPIFISIVLIIGSGLVLLLGKIKVLGVVTEGIIIKHYFYIYCFKNVLIEYDEIESINHTEDYTIEKEMTSNYAPGYMRTDPSIIAIKLKDGTEMEFRYHILKEKLQDFTSTVRKELK